MDLRPSSRLLSPHAGLACLLIVEVAIGLLLCVWAWQAFALYRHARDADSGLPEAQLLDVPPLGAAARGRVEPRDVAAVLAEVEGVRSVSIVNQSPYGMTAWNAWLSATPRGERGVMASMYLGEASLAATLGARVVQGRALDHHDVEPFSARMQRTQDLPVLVTQALADRLYPSREVIGRPLYDYGRTLRIVGVIESLPPPFDSRASGAQEPASVVLALAPDDIAWARYLVRGDEHDTGALLARLQTRLRTQYPAYAITPVTSIAALRTASLQRERRMAWTVTLCAAGWWMLILLSQTAAGHLWIQQSLVRIGLHRAVGATRAQIRHAVRRDHLALALSGWLLALVGHHAMQRWVDWPWSTQPPSLLWPVLAVGVVVLTQCAATWPARRAASIPPDHVTRGRWVRL